MQKTILIIIILIVLIAIILGAYYFFANSKQSVIGPVGNKKTNTSEIQGMKIEILKEGSGQAAKDGDLVTVNYVGTLQNGIKFDSSIDRNAPFSFTLGAHRVIKGWDLGVVGMKIGEKRKLTIPPELGYGSVDFLTIPKDSTLIFEIDMLKINN